MAMDVQMYKIQLVYPPEQNAAFSRFIKLQGKGEMACYFNYRMESRVGTDFDPANTYDWQARSHARSTRQIME
jgi:hypothetical protein